MAKMKDLVKEILEGRYYATLATTNEDGSIHMTPVWYLFENDGLFIESSSVSRKVKNIEARPEVSLMIDVRKLGSEKWASASGTAEIVRGESSKAINEKIVERYMTKAAREDPRVGPVMAAGDDVTIKITPRRWRSWDMKSLDNQFFGGILSSSPEKWFLPLDG